MLYIEVDHNENEWVSWLIGQPLPKINNNGREVNLKADEKELEVILEALKATNRQTVTS